MNKPQQLCRHIDRAIQDYSNVRIRGKFPRDIIELLEDLRDFIANNNLAIKYETLDRKDDGSYNVQTDTHK